MIAADCVICQQIERVQEGTHPGLIAQLPLCNVVLHTQQGQRGWCVLHLREHHEHLAELPLAVQADIFTEVALVAGVVRSVTGCRRINYECLGNVAAHVHWHIIPRYTTDHDVRAPVWGFPSSVLDAPIDEPTRAALIARIAAALRTTASPGWVIR